MYSVIFVAFEFLDRQNEYVLEQVSSLSKWVVAENQEDQLEQNPEFVNAQP